MKKFNELAVPLALIVIAIATLWIGLGQADPTVQQGLMGTGVSNFDSITLSNDLIVTDDATVTDDLTVTDDVTINGGAVGLNGTTPKLTVGDAGAEDTTILFDGNAQDFYVALDDSVDDFLIGLGAAVGTTPGFGLDENLAIATYGDVTMNGTTPVLTIGDTGAEDTTILFDGNAQDFYVALDDSADDLLLGLGNAVGTTPGLGIDENLAIATYGDITMNGTTPNLTMNDGGAEDSAILWNGNAQDFYFGLDDSVDDLVVGLGSALGTTQAFGIDENLVTTWVGGTIELAATTTEADVLTVAECGKTIFLNSATEYQTTLPAISTAPAGCTFTFFVKAAPSGANYTIITGNSQENAIIIGVNELEVDTGDDGPYINNGDVITFIGGTSVVGDYVYLISDGTNWYGWGQTNADGGITLGST